jgi:hypothetical protein
MTPKQKESLLGVIAVLLVTAVLSSTVSVLIYRASFDFRRKVHEMTEARYKAETAKLRKEWIQEQIRQCGGVR